MVAEDNMDKSSRTLELHSHQATLGKGLKGEIYMQKNQTPPHPLEAMRP